MTSIKDWVFSQVVSKSVGATRPLSASENFLSQDSQNELSQDSQNEELSSRGIAFHFIIIISNLLHRLRITYCEFLVFWDFLFPVIQHSICNKINACFFHLFCASRLLLTFNWGFWQLGAKIGPPILLNFVYIFVLVNRDVI